MQHSSADLPASPLHFYKDDMSPFLLQGAVALYFFLDRLLGQIMSY